jgi:hypothetical protein
MTAFGVDFSKPIQTRDGRKVRVLCQDMNSEDYRVAAVITDGSGYEHLESYTKDGSFRRDGMETGLDLVNVPEVVETKLKLQCCECHVKSNGWMHFRFDNNAYRWHFSPEETHEIFTALCRVQFDVFGDNSKQKENGNHSHE